MLVLSVFFYLIPSAIISTDLAVTYPLDGGYVAWIDEAFGSVLGAQNMYWCVVRWNCAMSVADDCATGRGSTTF